MTLPQPATNNDEAVALLDAIARTLAMRNGMVSGYLSVYVGAGNPAYFYKVVYQQDGYDAAGFAKSGGAISAHAPTLLEAVNLLRGQIVGREPS